MTNDYTRHGKRPLPSLDSVQSLVGRFSPAVHGSGPQEHLASAADRRALWAADSIHRSNNLAQMAESLARITFDKTGQPGDNGVAARARALARAYAELGSDDDDGAHLPCAELLAEIASRLGTIFGGGDRTIAVECTAGHIAMPADQRRALILIASELVINALKYAFPDNRDGTIAVVLGAEAGLGTLIVTDDGIGLASDHAPGQGHALIDGLGAVVGATIMRRGSNGRGLQVVVAFPLHTHGGH